MVQLEEELLKVPADSIGEATSVFCQHRSVALTTWLSDGVVTAWEIFSCNSLDHLKGQHAVIETQLIVNAALESSSSH
jgi:hypothetical protein